MKFMGPFACWSMGQGAHSMPNQGAFSDFRTIMRDQDFYPQSQKRGIVDLSDFRWRFTAGKCMWWNQMFRSQNEPQTLPDDRGGAEGSYKVFRMCLIYSFMMSRHWTAQNDGAAYEIALVKGMMQEFGKEEKGAIASERKKLVDELKFLNGVTIGEVWTILYEFGMSPCVNYIVIFGMLLEVIGGLDVVVPVTISKKTGCIDPESKLPVYQCVDQGDLITVKNAQGALGPVVGPGVIKFASYLPPLSFAKPAFMALQKLLAFMKKPLEIFRKAWDSFLSFKFAASDPLDVIWIHGGDVIGILEILFMIPIPAIQRLFEGLVKSLKLVPIMSIINKALSFIVKLVFKNPVATAILKGPAKVCEMILKAFVNNPVAKGMVALFKGFMSLLDKPVKFSLGGKRFCFTVLGILKKVEAMFKMILDKIMHMIKAILKPIFKIIDAGFKKIASLVKLPKFNVMNGLFGQAGNLWDMLKSVGAFDNPFKTFATCAFNLPWVQESGQNLCNCCMFGYAVSNRISYGWLYNKVQQKLKYASEQAKCTKYGLKTCTMTETTWKQPQLAAMFMSACPTNPLTGAKTSVGKSMYAALSCINKSPQMKARLMTALVLVFKGFLCRFQNIGLNPKVMMQLSPLPPIELFRRRRAGNSGTTPGIDKCKAYVKGGKSTKSLVRRRRKRTQKEKKAVEELQFTDSQSTQEA